MKCKASELIGLQHNNYRSAVPDPVRWKKPTNEVFKKVLNRIAFEIVLLMGRDTNPKHILGPFHRSHRLGLSIHHETKEAVNFAA